MKSGLYHSHKESFASQDNNRSENELSNHEEKPPHDLSLLPKPFEWCRIPAGNIELIRTESSYLTQDTIKHIPTFFIAKYPITNKQYAVFETNSDGFSNQEWWDFSTGAKKWRNEHPIPYETGFTGDDRPRTRITWYEAVAYTRWLSYRMNRKIVLPSDAMWQRAAQGDDKRIYPWGNDELMAEFANFGSKINTTTPVTAYPKNKSPYGVMDMSGNVSEWCSTSFEHGDILLDGADDNKRYIYRGGTWRANYPDALRVDTRNGLHPNDEDTGKMRGFRIACLLHLIKIDR